MTTVVDAVILAQDPYNPEFTPFPAESFITARQLRDAVFEWAFGEVIPAPAAMWRSVSAWDVRWPVGSGY